MKLAEALQERADLNRKIGELNGRLNNNALVQEGEETAEDPKALLKELDKAVARLEEVTAAVNERNCRTVVEGRSLTAWIARRDALRIQISSYRSLTDAASRTVTRGMRTEIKILSAVNVKELQRRCDALSKELRLVENRIQEINWTTEL